MGLSIGRWLKFLHYKPFSSEMMLNLFLIYFFYCISQDTANTLEKPTSELDALEMGPHGIVLLYRANDAFGKQVSYCCGLFVFLIRLQHVSVLDFFGHI
jgi:hypothetical protein